VKEIMKDKFVKYTRAEKKDKGFEPCLVCARRNQSLDGCASGACTGGYYVKAGEKRVKVSPAPEKAIIRYFRRNEWTMGNGQCRDCHGAGRPFAGQTHQDMIGHTAKCEVAKILESLGQTVIRKGKYKHTRAEAKAYALIESWTCMMFSEVKK
jgi:hypothetical protein